MRATSNSSTTLSLLVILIVVLIDSVNTDPLVVSLQFCNVEELKRSLQRHCMRLGRETDISTSPYGTVSSRFGSSDLMDDVLKASIPYGRGFRFPQVFKRELNDNWLSDDDIQSRDSMGSCCTAPCSTKMEDIAPRCSSL